MMNFREYLLSIEEEKENIETPEEELKAKRVRDKDDLLRKPNLGAKKEKEEEEEEEEEEEYSDTFGGKDPRSEENPEDGLDFDDIDLTNTKANLGTYANSFNNNLTGLYVERFSKEAKATKEYLSGDNIFFNKDGSLKFITLTSRTVSSEEGQSTPDFVISHPNTRLRTDSKIDEPRIGAEKFIRMFQHGNYKVLFIYLYTVLRNNAIKNKGVDKVLEYYMPKELISACMKFDNIDTLARESSIYGGPQGYENFRRSEQKKLNNKNVYSQREFTALSYMVFSHFGVRKGGAKAKSRAMYEEIFGKLNPGEWMPVFYSTPSYKGNVKKKQEESEAHKNINRDTRKNYTEQEMNREKEKDERTEVDDGIDFTKRRLDEFKEAKGKDSDKKLHMPPEFIRVDYYGKSMDDVIKDYKSMLDVVRGGKILSEFESEESDIFPVTIKSINKVEKGLLDEYSKQSRSYQTKISAAERGSGRIWDKSKTNMKSMARDLDLDLEESYDVKKIEKIAGENTKSEDVNILMKKARNIHTIYMSRINSYIKKIDKKVDAYVDTRKRIKNFDEKRYVNDLGYHINLAKVEARSLIDRLNKIINDYKEIIYTRLSNKGIEDSKLREILENPKDFMVMRDRTSQNIAKILNKKADKDEKREERKKARMSKKGLKTDINLTFEKVYKASDDIEKATLARFRKSSIDKKNLIIAINTWVSKSTNRAFFTAEKIKEFSDSILSPHKETINNITESLKNIVEGEDKNIETLFKSLTPISKTIESLDMSFAINFDDLAKTVSYVHKISSIVKRLTKEGQEGTEDVFKLARCNETLKDLIKEVDMASAKFSNDLRNKILSSGGQSQSNQQSQGDWKTQSNWHTQDKGEEQPQGEGMKPALTTKKINPNLEGEDEKETSVELKSKTKPDFNNTDSLDTKVKKDKEDEDEEESPEIEPKNLLDLAKQKLKASK